MHYEGRPGAVVLMKGIVPEKAHHDDAAYDLIACTSFPVVLHSKVPEIVPTGTFMAIPKGHVGLVCSRSGLAARRGVFVLNSPGVIDPGYRGEIGVVLMNLDEAPYIVSPGERIAQLVIVPTTNILFLDNPERFDALETERGEDGFGSTGVAR